jgi:hypothetical protein
VVRWEGARDDANEPADRLVAFFADVSGCGRAGRVQRAFTEAGFVVACLELYESEDAAYGLPFVEQEERVDRVLRAALSSEEVRQRWSGKDLLLAGANEGATAAMVVMARTDVDAGAHFRGNVSTAGCFFEGSYDVDALDRLLGEGRHGRTACSHPLSHARAIGRYYDDPPEEHSCEQHRCPCDPDHAPAIDVDSIVTAPAEAWTISTFFLVACGSELEPCTGDVVPEEPARALCEKLDEAEATSCTFESMPHTSHGSCASVAAGRCAEWATRLFDAH